MDYWEYLAHSQQGAEKENHRYYARELVGTKGGQNVYRYFYTAEEYGAYRRGKQSHAGTASSEKNSLLDKARKSHSENRWRPSSMIVVNGNYAHTTYKNSAGKKRVTDYRGKTATRKAENEFHSKSDKSYERNRSLMEAVYQTDKALRRAKRKTQKAGMDIKRSAKKGAAAVSNLLGKRKKKSTSNSDSTAKKTTASGKRSTASNSKSIGEQHSMDRKRWDTQARAAQVKKDAKAYRKKRRAANKATRDGQKRIMDNVRERPYYSPKKV